MAASERRIICIQPVLSQTDYRSGESFYCALKTYLIKVQQKGWLNENSVVCFPEYIATWLVFLNAPEFVFSAHTFASAIRRMFGFHLFKILRKTIFSKAKSKFTEAIFRLNEKQIAKVYQETFSRLAREFNVTIVGGSVVLANPSLIDGDLKIDPRGSLRNISCVWNPDGQLMQLIPKMSPTEPELKFSTGGALRDIKPVMTPAGCLGFIICGDGWEQKIYDHLASQGADAFIVLSFVPSDVAWQEPWKGYSGKQPEPDVDPTDVGLLTESQAWKKYCLCRAEKYKKPSIVFFNRTQLWDFGSHGQPLMFRDGQMTEYQIEKNGESMVCIAL